MPAPVKFVQPPVSLGDVVLWRHNRASVDPAPALVTRVGPMAVSVLIFATDSKNGIIRDGVRHESDPTAATVISDAGVWSYSESGKLLSALAQAAALAGSKPR